MAKIGINKKQSNLIKLSKYKNNKTEALMYLSLALSLLSLLKAYSLI
jgi:hypothetical protein